MPAASRPAIALACACVAQPQVVWQQRDPLRRGEAHLRRELHELLAGVQRVDVERRVEDHHRLGLHGAVLGAAEREDVGAGRRLAQPDTERSGGVRQPRAVDVHEQAELVRGSGECVRARRRSTPCRVRWTA